MGTLLALLFQLGPTDGLEQGLIKARESFRPMCLLWIDEGDSSQALLKTFHEDAAVRKLAGLFELVKVKGPKPEFLLDLPLPAVAVAEPTWIPHDKRPDWTSIRRACRGFVSLAGEFTPQDEEILNAIKTSGRGGSQKIGPMPLKDCIPMVGVWISLKNALKRPTVVIDSSVPEGARVEWKGGTDHIFESFLQACTHQNRLLMYPSGGAIVLAGRLPRDEIEPAALRDLLGRFAEPEGLSVENHDRFEEAIGRLSDNNLEVREAATHVLKAAGAKVRRLLRKALADAPDSGASSRLESILQPVR